MRKRAERTLKELYDLTERISEPKITPVLKGSCRIQGPVDDLDIHLQGTHSDERILFPEDCTGMRTEAGTCTVCSAPCSLCMHYKSESGFSYNLSARTEADSSSVINVDEMPVLRSRRRVELQHAASETSVFLSTSSSYDSYSENAKIKTNLRASEASDASDDVDMPQVLFSGKVNEEDQHFKRNTDQSQFCLPSDTPQLSHRFPSGKVDGQSGLECHGDNILCISGAGDSNVVVCDSNVDIEEKGMHYRNMSASSLIVGNKNIIADEAGNDNQDNETGERSCISKRSNATLDSSLLHNSCNLTSVNNVAHAKSQLSSHIDDVSPATFHLTSHPEYANSSFKGEPIVIEGNLNSQPEAEISRCAEVDKLDSSLTSLTFGNSRENECSTSPKHEVSEEKNGIQGRFPSRPLVTDGLWHDTKSGTDCGKPSDNCSDNEHANDLLERDGAILASTKGEDLNMQKTLSVDENYELEAALDDVKVCDTCGDAGREDLLAICSRCSDGAEHTYCMREMLDKVPEGEWLCEECKIKEMENQNVDECEAHKLNTRQIDLDARGSVKGLQGYKFPTKMQVDHSEEGKASELSDASIETAGPRKKPSLSGQISSKIKDARKMKAAIMEMSSEIQPAKGSDTFSRPKTYLSSSSFKGLAPLYSPRGNFSRSVSFNNSNLNHNAKTLIENAPSKQRSTREHTTNDLRKDSLLKSSTKTTFKNTTSGFSSTESTSKKPSLQQSLRGVKERNTVEKKNFSAIENSSVRPLAAIVSNYPHKADTKSVQLQSDEKLNNSSETIVRRSSEGFDAYDLGSNEGKKHILYSSKCNESSNGNYADNPRRSKVISEGIRRSISDVDGSHRKFEIASSNSVVQPLEFGYKGNRKRDSTTSTGSRLLSLGGNRTFHPQSGNETGRVTNHCSMDKPGVSAHKIPGEQKLREVDKKGNRWREVVVAAMSKSELKCDKIDAPEELLVASVDMISEAATKHIPTTLNQRSFLIEQRNSKITSNDSTMVPTSTLALTGSVRSDVLSVDASYKANSTRDTCATELSAKSLTETMRGEPPLLANQLSASAVPNPPHLGCPLNVSAVPKPPLFANPSNGSAVPKLEYIWQGSFNVIGTGSPPKLFFGIQAHLSNCASHRVSQVATKAPGNIQLEEISHISSCPLQVLRAGPQEENIALFFFAKDVDSYEKSYRKLLDKMHRNDLALRGNIDGDELLIFTSNKLPIISQRWNKMHYLWGMFRGKRRNCLQVMDDKESLLSNQDFSVQPIKDVSNEQSLDSSLKLKKLSDSTESKGKPGESIDGVDMQTISFQIEDKKSLKLVAFPVQNLLNQVPADPKVPQGQPSFLGSSSGTKAEPLRTTIATLNLDLPIFTTKSCSEEKKVDKNDGTCQEKNVSDCTEIKAGVLLPLAYEMCVESSISSLTKTLSAPSVSSNCTKGSDCIIIKEENGEKETLPPSMAIVDDDQRVNVLGADLVSCESTNRKRARSSSMETVVRPSCKMSKDTVLSSWLPVEEEREKPPPYPCATSIINSAVSARFSSKVHPVHSNILRHRQPGENTCNETSIPENTRSKERCFFPLDLGPVQNTKSTNTINITSSDNDTLESSSPDLELALGGKSISTKPFVLSSLFHSVDGGKQQRQPDPSVDGDDTSASLSLSLFSFPVLDKERSAT